MGHRTSVSEESFSGARPSFHSPLHSMFINHHLNIEAQLEDLIRSQFRDPDPDRVNFERLPFPAKIELASALAGPQADDDLWDMLLKFNETRNSIAHRKKKLPQQKFAELRVLVTNAKPSLPVADDNQVMTSAFKICSWFIQDIKQSLPKPLPQDQPCKC